MSDAGMLGGLRETRDAVTAGRAGAVEMVEASLAAIDRSASLNAFVELHEREALAAAARLDARRAAGEPLGPLAGAPIAVKANICTTTGTTTCSSAILAGYRSPFDAAVVERLTAAGGVVIGKTAMDEFGMGSSGEYAVTGPVRNPHDESRTPGGSSSGAAAGVAAGLVPGALGSDTGGSVRQPAAMCGVVGLRPTYGRVSRWGLVAYASSLDQVGPITRDVGDAALLFSVLAGHDPREATSAPRPVEDALADLETPVERPRIGVLADRAVAGAEPSAREALTRAASSLGDAGAELVETDPPGLDHAVSAYYVIASAEASSNLARFDGVRYGRRADLTARAGLDELYTASRTEGFGPEVKRRIILGTYALSAGYYDAYYQRALRVRRLILDGFEGLLGRADAPGGIDALLTPTTPGPAFRLGERLADPMALYLEDYFTVAASLAGLPAISVPAGSTPVDGRALPLGVQLTARAFDEARLLRLARMLERALA